MFTFDFRPLVSALAVATVIAAGRASAQTTGALPPGAAHAMALGRIGGSGLRSLLSASGSLGDLANRAGSYRLAAHLERARAAALQGRITALEGALADPALPAPERQRLSTELESASEELRAVPRYEAAYRAATAQAEALSPAGLVGGRPLFLLLRGRAHARRDHEEGRLTVFSEAATFGAVWLPSDRLLVGASLGAGRTDVDIAPFDGQGGSWSIGPRLNFGGILRDGWGASLELGHSWSHGASTVVRPGPDQPIKVRSSGWSEVTSMKTEIVGRLVIAARETLPITIRPRAGVFLTTTHSRPTTNSLGETSTGPFGARETLAALRAGASLATRLGAWSPRLYLGWELELTDEISRLIPDGEGLLAVVGMSRLLGQGRRLVLDYALIRGQKGLRRVSELTAVLILDG